MSRSVEARQRGADVGLVGRQQVAPALVADLGGARRAGDDVAEQDGEQRPLALGAAPRAGQELLDLSQQRVAVAAGGQRVGAGQLDEPRARDPPRVLARVTHVDERVAGAVHDERRRADRRQLRPRVDLRGRGDEPPHPPRARRQPLEAREPRPQLLVVGRARGERVEVRALAPAREDLVEARRALGRLGQPRQVVVAHGAQRARVEDQAADALRVTRGEDRRQRPARRVGQQRRALAAGRVEHRAHVGDLVVDAELAVVRQPRAAAIHEDQPREARQALEEPREPGVLPDVLDVVDERADEQQVDRPVAVHLVGEVDVAVAGVARGRRTWHVNRSGRARRDPG